MDREDYKAVNEHKIKKVVSVQPASSIRKLSISARELSRVALQLLALSGTSPLGSATILQRSHKPQLLLDHSQTDRAVAVHIGSVNHEARSIQSSILGIAFEHYG
jgi:hypothetical protein